MKTHFKGKPYLLKETNWKNVGSTKFSTAVLPWGATEPHNYHLPYGTDIFESEHISELAAEHAWNKGAKVIVLPAIPFGVNTGQINYNLVVNMNPSTQYLVLRDVVDSISRQSINKLVILNSHGGNDFKPMIRELKLSHPKIFICLINWYTLPDIEKFFTSPGDHAGEMETSMMMKIAPELVLPLNEVGTGFEKKIKLEGLKNKLAWTQRDWQKITSDTGVGNPKLSSAEKGEKFLVELKKRIGEFLVELASADLDDLYEA
ncbi:MAG: creatininase family protein [Ignavibacteriaceae bacterium]|nr:creatininase family protein [Ignavibacteriaceae bacterium]